MDRFLILKVLFLILIASLAAPAQPVINQGGVLNAASYAVPGLLHSDIAQGSMFVVFGQRLGPDTLRLVQLFPLPTELAGTSIRVTGGGVTADAIMIYTSAGQAAAILPSRIPLGEASITLTYNNQTSAPARIRVARSSFGIFTRNQAGSGPGIVQNYISATDQPVNALTEVAHPGQVMILWGTGLGPVDFDETRPPAVRNLDVDLDVLVGNDPARVLYKGRSPQFPGIDQINFELPADAPEGCYVPLVVRAGAVVSNFTTISIAPGGRVCSDAVGLSVADLETLRNTGQLRTGGIVLSKTIIKDLNGFVDNLSADFDLYDHETALKALSVGFEAGEFDGPRLPLGTCILNSAAVKAGALGLPKGPARPQSFLPGPGGSVLNWQGPRGLLQKPVPISSSVGGGVPGLTGNYGPEYLVPGVYTVDNMAGGPMVGRFRATLTLPAPLEWTNQDSLTVIRRSQDLTVTWNGGDSSKEYVVISANSYSTTQEVGAEITCIVRASAGRFTIPSWLMAMLPASGILPGTSIPQGIVALGSHSILGPTRFQAQGLDVGFFGYEIISFKFVPVQ
jgi:uncharacterized protein (TIGR03437 family)